MVAVADDSVAEAVAKYFFFICLDEQLSFAASLKVLNELKAGNRLDRDHRDHWVAMLHKWKPRLAHLRPRPWTDHPREQGFLFPQEFDLAGWVSFMSATDFEEVEAVLFSRVLGISDAEISKGLNVTVGTVRYRIGRGLRHLGGFLEP